MTEEEPEAPRPRRARPEETETSVDPSSTPATSDPEAPPPLFRDEAGLSRDEAGLSRDEAPDPTGRPTSSADADPDADADADAGSEDPASPASPTHPELSDETTILSRARELKRTRTRPDPDETTLLPRTAGGGRVRRRAADDRADDLDDDLDDEVSPTADRRRLWLMVGAVAVVAVLGLLAGYAIIKTTSQPVAGPGEPTGTTGSADTSPSAESSSPDGTAVITDAMLLSPTQAETLDSKRTWKIALTQKGTSADSPNHPACLASDATEGAPVPQQTVLRLLSSTGSSAPAALHQATSYGSPEEAAQAFAFAARTLGDCAMSGAWISAGHVIGGVGDQATGVTLQVKDGSSEEFRTVVLTRTGRIVDVVDVAKPDKAVTAKRVAEVAGDVVDTQCQAAGGSCSDEPEAQDGPPPLGGDQPGFLASGDLPPMGPELTRWAGTTPGAPDPDLLRGSGCETVNWSKVEAEDRSHRTYLLSDSSSKFGLDEVLITTKDDAAATKLAEKVRDDWKGCGKRQLTATVADLTDVSGAGAKSIDVTGWTTKVSQKAGDKTTQYRVGIVTAGPKVAFVFLNPQGDLDLTADQFDTVAVRAGQRATQVS